MTLWDQEVGVMGWWVNLEISVQFGVHLLFLVKVEEMVLHLVEVTLIMEVPKMGLGRVEELMEETVEVVVVLLMIVVLLETFMVVVHFMGTQLGGQHLQSYKAPLAPLVMGLGMQQLQMLCQKTQLVMWVTVLRIDRLEVYFSFTFSIMLLHATLKSYELLLRIIGLFTSNCLMRKN